MSLKKINCSEGLNPVLTTVQIQVILKQTQRGKEMKYVKLSAYQAAKAYGVT
jgi:hypothetical protein